jgi:hypothetical protein
VDCLIDCLGNSVSIIRHSFHLSLWCAPGLVHAQDCSFHYQVDVGAQSAIPAQRVSGDLVALLNLRQTSKSSKSTFRISGDLFVSPKKWFVPAAYPLSCVLWNPNYVASHKSKSSTQHIGNRSIVPGTRSDRARYQICQVVPGTWSCQVPDILPVQLTEFYLLQSERLNKYIFIMILILAVVYINLWNQLEYGQGLRTADF